MAWCIELDIYYSETCRSSASFMSKGGILIERACELHAQICEECGKEWAKHQHNHCQRCALACENPLTSAEKWQNQHKEFPESNYE